MSMPYQMETFRSILEPYVEIVFEAQLRYDMIDRKVETDLKENQSAMT